MSETLNTKILHQRSALEKYIEPIVKDLADNCTQFLSDIDSLDNQLDQLFQFIKISDRIYLLDCAGTQISSNISRLGIDQSCRGQDLSIRPYVQSMTENKSFLLSPVYIDKVSRRPCLTALHQVINPEGERVGCIAADFDLDHLPTAVNTNNFATDAWRQIKGDPSIRKNLFAQVRTISPMDEKLDTVNDIICDLMMNRRIFHAKLHYSSSRATLWHYDKPHRYQLHVLDEIIDPSVCLAYDKGPYPEDAEVKAETIPLVFERLKQLRNADETIYLRMASLNTINNMVGLTFSCDGSHYMSTEAFLEKDEEFWFGVKN